MLTTLTCNRSSVPSAQRTWRDYDSRNRLTAVTYPDGNTLGYSYFADGALHTATAQDAANWNMSWTYAYNRRRLLTSETSNLESMAFTHSYNALGHLASTSYPAGYVASYAPNALGQPTQVTGFASGATYHPNGALKGFSFDNGILRQVELNARGLPARIFDRVPNGPIHLDLRHSYDANANLTGISDLGQGGMQNRTMTYDGLDRLVTAYAPYMFGHARYAYDPLDNLREADQDARKYRYVYDSTGRASQIKTIRRRIAGLHWERATPGLAFTWDR
jgi:YD repeat-containing protein